MKKQTISIILLLATGSILSTVYAANTVITNTSVTTTNLNAVNLILSGTCTGCGGGEGNFNSYSIMVNESAPNTNNNPPTSFSLSNTGTLYGCSNFGEYFAIAINGTELFYDVNNCNHGPDDVGQQAQSGTGKYFVTFNIINSTNSEIFVYKNDIKIQTIERAAGSGFTCFNNNDAIIGISPDGKYIGYQCSDIGSTNTQWVYIWQGS